MFFDGFEGLSTLVSCGNQCVKSGQTVCDFSSGSEDGLVFRSEKF